MIEPPPPPCIACTLGHVTSERVPRLVFVLPLVAITGSVAMWVRETIGPSITLAAWLAVIVVTIVRNARAARRGESHHVSWFELIPVVSCLVILQLLLDLYSPHAGDIAIGVLQAPLIAIAIYGAIRGS